MPCTVNVQVGSTELRRLLRSPYKLEESERIYKGFCLCKISHAQEGIKEKLRVADDGVLKPANLAVEWPLPLLYIHDAGRHFRKT